MSALGHERTLESGSGISALPPEEDMRVVGIDAPLRAIADVKSILTAWIEVYPASSTGTCIDR